MATPLMPKATAVWLIQNTSLTFKQISDFCGLHILEIKGIADGDVAKGIIGLDPIVQGQLTQQEIKRCEANPEATLSLSESALRLIHEQKQKKISKYTPIARREDKPEAIAWLLKNCPELSNAQIAKLVGSTKPTVLSIRDKTHWNIANIRPKDPVLLGICSQTELNLVYGQAKARAEALKDSKLENK
ncbi:MAG: DUF1013 domain-containing protein [Candidatus Midichloria sp.]|nr:MAG: DUF1013 domain-containing protein [Candidatus Midichloria sp.]